MKKRRRPVVIMGKRDWRWLWLRRKRHTSHVNPTNDHQVFSDPWDKERRSR